MIFFFLDINDPEPNDPLINKNILKSGLLGILRILKKAFIIFIDEISKKIKIEDKFIYEIGSTSFYQFKNVKFI